MICEKKYSIDDDDIGWDRETDKEKEEDKERKTKTKTKNIGRQIIPTAKSSVRRIRKRRIWERRIRKRRRIRGEFVTQPLVGPLGIKSST